MDISSKSRGLVAAAAVASLAALAACDRHHDATPAGASPSAVVIGTAPANPTGAEPPGVTPVAPNTKDISKATESTQKPQEGDNHSYSTEATKTPQKADGTNPTSSSSGGRQ